MWRPKGWEEIKNKELHYSTSLSDEFYLERGADAMHKADVDWLIERIVHDDRGYVFNMTDKEWQEFIGED